MKQGNSYENTQQGQVSFHSMTEWLDISIPETRLLCSLINWSTSAHALGNILPL